jgi:carbonic anhydrase
MMGSSLGSRSGTGPPHLTGSTNTLLIDIEHLKRIPSATEKLQHLLDTLSQSNQPYIQQALLMLRGALTSESDQAKEDLQGKERQLMAVRDACKREVASVKEEAREESEELREDIRELQGHVARLRDAEIKLVDQEKLQAQI